MNRLNMNLKSALIQAYLRLLIMFSPTGLFNYHFAFVVESNGDPITLRAQLKIDVILVFTGFKCHKIIAGTA